MITSTKNFRNTLFISMKLRLLISIFALLLEASINQAQAQNISVNEVSPQAGSVSYYQTLDLGNVAVGSTKHVDFAIINTDFNNALFVQNLTSNPDPAISIALPASPPLPSILGPFQQTTFSVDFSPTSVGSSLTNISIQSDDPTLGSFIFFITGNGIIPTTSIAVTGAGNATTISTSNGTLQMNAVVSPANATDKTVTWSITNGIGSASVSGSGLLTASGNGTVTVKATANDGSGVTGSEVITISGQNAPLQVISFPDPNLRAAIFAQYGDYTVGGPRAVGNGALHGAGPNDIDFTNLFTTPNTGPSPGVLGVLSINSYGDPNNNPSGQITDLTGIEKLPNLTFLDIQNHSIAQLPANINLLTKLQVVDLTSNKITTLPASFTNLNSLTALILSYNQLTILPNLSGLINLSQLEVANNQLTTLPALPANLGYLIAKSNKLTSLPAFISPANGGLVTNPDITSNNLTFEDIESLVINGVSATLNGNYYDQANFSITPSTINLSTGQALNLTAAGFIGGANNRYQWFRDGEAVTQINVSPTFSITSVMPGDGGSYVCQVTNTIVTDLAISSDPITVSVTPLALQVSDQLWGMTMSGGTGNGSIFNINGSTNVVQVVSQFNSIEGKFPFGNLMLASDGFFYGMTRQGGVNDLGTIFRIGTDGAQFQKLYDFDPAIGGYPTGSLTQASDGNLYGMASYGTNQQLTGIIFRINVGPVPVFNKIYEFTFDGLPSGNLIQGTNGDLYGMTKIGTNANAGTIFKIKTDGSGFQILHVFSDLALEGHQPFGSLIQASNGNLYGMTHNGGLNTQGDGGGTIFRIKTDGSGFQKLIDMDYTAADAPTGDLMQASNGDLYGMAHGYSISPVKGYIFKIGLNGSTRTILHEFNGTDGASPVGNLTEAPNGELYGMTMEGGANGKGVLFKVRPDGTGFNKLYDFGSTGNQPQGSLLFFKSRQSQTITFNALPTKSVVDPMFALTATSNSGLAVTYTSSNTSVATISQSIVTIVGPGSTTITASQTGNANYNAASDVTQALIVNKAAQTITFSALSSKNYGDAIFTLGATANSGLAVTYTSSDANVATVNGNTVTIVGGGTTTITAKQSGNSNYNAATDVPQTLTVNKINQTITFAALSANKYGDAAFVLRASASSGLSVTYSSSNPGVAQINGATLTIVGTGTATITANQPGNANYNAAADVTQTLTVSKADQTIAFPALTSKNQGDAAFTLSATSTSRLNIVYTITSGPATVTGTIITLTGAGRVTVKASQPGNTNYNAATDVIQSFCVNPFKPTISFSVTDPQHPVLTASNSTGNQWYLNGTAIANATSATHAATQPGSYTVSTTIGGCSGIASDPQIVVVTGVEKTLEHAMVCYPNPSQNEVTINYGEPEQVQELQIVDATGRVMQAGGRELLNKAIPIDSFGVGIYIVKVKAAGQVMTGKFLKK